MCVWYVYHSKSWVVWDYRSNPSFWLSQLLVRLEVLLAIEVEVKEVLALLVVTDLTCFFRLPHGEVRTLSVGLV